MKKLQLKIKIIKCPYCQNAIPYPYSLKDHKMMCKNVDNSVRLINNQKHE